VVWDRHGRRRGGDLIKLGEGIPGGEAGDTESENSSAGEKQGTVVVEGLASHKS
jgi:hypothetical protein